MKAVRFLAGLGIAFAAASVTPTAHADDQSYLSALAGIGAFPTWTTPASALIDAGHQICDHLRAGVPPQDAAIGTVFTLGAALGAPVVPVTQRELCPDTLR